jgi:hypothetical protein
MGSWAYDTHLTQQDIYELRDLIEAGVSEEPADTGNPRIILKSAVSVGIVVDMHGSEFIAPESLAKKSYSFLPKENWAFGVQSNEQYYDGYEPGENEQHYNQGGEHIH